MAQIDFDELTYRKAVIDQKDADLKSDFDFKLADKVDKSEVGGSNGILQLVNGNIPSNTIPFATSQEASDGTRNDVVMNPSLVRQEVSQAASLYVSAIDKNVPNGVAGLDNNSKIDISQIPNLSTLYDLYGRGNLNGITATISPISSYTSFTNFVNSTQTVNILTDIVNGKFTVVESKQYDLNVSISLSGITPYNTGSIISLEIYNITDSNSVFEYHMNVGINSTVCSGSFNIQQNFNANDEITFRFKETSGAVGSNVSVDNIYLNIKSV